MARLRTGWKQIINGAGRNVFVLESHYPLYEQIKRDHHKNYHLTSLLRTQRRTTRTFQRTTWTRRAITTPSCGSIRVSIKPKPAVRP